MRWLKVRQPSYEHEDINCMLEKTEEEAGRSRGLGDFTGLPTQQNSQHFLVESSVC